MTASQHAVAGAASRRRLTGVRADRPVLLRLCCGFYGLAGLLLGGMALATWTGWTSRPWPFPFPPAAVLASVVYAWLIAVGGWLGQRWAWWGAVALHIVVPIGMGLVAARHALGIEVLPGGLTAWSLGLKLGLHFGMLAVWVSPRVRAFCGVCR